MESIWRKHLPIINRALILTALAVFAWFGSNLMDQTSQKTYRSSYAPSWPNAKLLDSLLIRNSSIKTHIDSVKLSSEIDSEGFATIINQYVKLINDQEKTMLKIKEQINQESSSANSLTYFSNADRRIFIGLSLFLMVAVFFSYFLKNSFKLEENEQKNQFRREQMDQDGKYLLLQTYMGHAVLSQEEITDLQSKTETLSKEIGGFSALKSLPSVFKDIYEEMDSLQISNLKGIENVRKILTNHQEKVKSISSEDIEKEVLRISELNQHLISFQERLKDIKSVDQEKIDKVFGDNFTFEISTT